MYRNAYNLLFQWKAKNQRKPIIIQGVRQVGKTWLMKELGRNEFSQTAYFNFESTKELQNIFSQGLKTTEILTALQILCGFPIRPKETLVILDEIQACPDAVTALKYFQEEQENLHILAAGSLLGVAIHQGVSFPVGKVEFVTLYPLTFYEFLHAMGQEELVNALEQQSPVIETLAPLLTTFLKQYYFVGGMPEVVARFVETKDYKLARELQTQLLQSYENDFSKHAPYLLIPRIRLVWQSILAQLTKENAKFTYNLLRAGGRAKDFEMAIEWLKDAGMVHKIHRINKAGMPIQSYAQWNDFKMYLCDIGLLCAMGDLSPVVLLQDNQLFVEFKGILTEQFILQQLIAASNTPFYWRPENGTAEVDFVIQKENQIIPIEVKSSTNVKSRSLRVYFDTYQPRHCLRTSLAGGKHQDWMQNVPLYSFPAWLSRGIPQ